MTELSAAELKKIERLGEVAEKVRTQLKKKVVGLEGVIEQLLADPTQADQLVRRGTVWTKRRQAWGLPR